MVDRLKPWSALFTVIALVYFAWSAWYEPPVKKAERARMPEVAQSNVQTRDSRETPARLGDPCRLDRDGSRAPAAVSPAMSVSAQMASTLSIVNPGEPVRVPAENAIVFADSSAQALISGHTVKIGASIPGVDDEYPPILVWLDNVRAGVRYRGREYVLDLDRARHVTLEPVAPPAKPERPSKRTEVAPIAPAAPTPAPGETKP